MLDTNQVPLIDPSGDPSEDGLIGRDAGGILYTSGGGSWGAVGGSGGGGGLLSETELLVNPTHGNDSTGVRGDGSKPFATLFGAYGASQPRDTIICQSGDLGSTPLTVTYAITITAASAGGDYLTVFFGGVNTTNQFLAANGTHASAAIPTNTYESSHPVAFAGRIRSLSWSKSDSGGSGYDVVVNGAPVASVLLSGTAGYLPPATTVNVSAGDSVSLQQNSAVLGHTAPSGPIVVNCIFAPESN